MRDRIVEGKYHIEGARDARSYVSHVCDGGIDRDVPGICFSAKPRNGPGREAPPRTPNPPQTKRQSLRPDPASHVKYARRWGWRSEFALDQGLKGNALT